MDLTKLVNAGVLGGWVRAGVAALLVAVIHKFPGLSDVLSPDTRLSIAVAISAIVVGIWSHVAKNEAAKTGDKP